MSTGELQWIFPKLDEDWQNKIVKDFNIHPVTAQVLVARGYTTLDEIHSFLYGKLRELHDPKLFWDMPAAIKRIVHAIKHDQPIMIYGDTDVDGMTGTALLTEFLRSVGAEVYPFLPSRNLIKQSAMFDALEYCLKKQVNLMVTVDCGITAANIIDEFVKRGIDVIVTDHHEPTHKIPNCIATLNPKLINSTYPNRDLTGVGVAFKLIHAISNHLVTYQKYPKNKINLESYLDLVALGTVADMGALLGENRILVRYGMERLKKTKRMGLIKLMEVAEVNLDELSTTDIATKIAPRLNSMGRIDEPRKGLDLLLSTEEKEAERLAIEFDLNNEERQRIEKEMFAELEELLDKDKSVLKQKALILTSKKWHPGIIPILAAKIAKQYNRPVVLITIEGGVGKASMRTIRQFPLLPILKANEDLLLNYGGHDFAAGMTIPEKNIEKFKKKFLSMATRMLKSADLISKLRLDAEVSFEDLTFDFLESLSLFEPFGNENQPPVFYADVQQSWLPKIVGNVHLKMYLEQNGRTLEAIGFNMGHRKSEITRKDLKLRIAFIPQINRFLQKTSIQLLIRDFKVLN